MVSSSNDNRHSGFEWRAVKLLMIAIACVFKIAQTKRLPLYYIYSAIPAIGIFLIAYYFVGLNGNYGDLDAFLATNGGIWGSLFGT